MTPDLEQIAKGLTRAGDDRIAANCANWSIAPPFEIIGECQQCGVPWQDFHVAYSHRCACFTPRNHLLQKEQGR